MALYFSLWKSTKKDRDQSYDCDICRVNKWYENRVCYHDEFGEQENIVGIPIFIDNLPPLHILEQVGGGNIIENRELRNCDGEEVIEEITKIHEDVFPQLPLFVIANRFFKQPREVCCTALVDYPTHWLISLESSCSKYHCLPYVGGLFDQPAWVPELFELISSIRNEFERDRNDEMIKETSKK